MGTNIKIPPEAILCGVIFMDSLWMDQTSLPAFPRLQEKLETDVLVIGGGLAGILCARRLRELGVDCILLEAERLCGGVTGRTTAKLTAQHGLIYAKLVKRLGLAGAKAYLAANLTALEALKTLAQGMDCGYRERDNYVYSRWDRGAIDGELAALKALGYPARFQDLLPLPFPVAGAVCFPRQGQFDPLRFVSGLLEGLRVYEHSPVRSLVPGRAETDAGSVKARAIIVCSHFPFLNRHGSYFLKLYQHRSYVLALENAPQVEGMYVDDSDTGLSFRNHRELLLLGGGGHRVGKEGGGWEELEAFARRHWPKARVKYRWAAQDCMSLDGVPYIGQYSRHAPGLYVAAGFNKWGMTSSMAAALILGDLVTGKDNPWARVFSPSRTILRPQLAVNAGEAAVSLLTPTVPRCPHMGCALKWNETEGTWDCPCHGSRFTREGRLLSGPATGDLKGHRD